MAIVTSAATGVVGAGAGIAAGARGKKGGKPQVTDQTSRVDFGEKSMAQKNLENQSRNQYRESLRIIDDQQRQLGELDPLRAQALGNAQGILSGQAFSATPEEMARVQDLRQAYMDQANADIGLATDEGLRRAVSSAASRGLRGQALGQTQANVVNEAQRQIGSASRQANTNAQQQLMQMPYQRVGAQQQALQYGLTAADQLRQQAFNNRQLSQNPYLLNLLSQERMAGGTRYTTNVAPGTQPGGPGSAIGAGLAGLAGGLNYGQKIATGFENLFGNSGGGGGTNAGSSGGYQGFTLPGASQTPSFIIDPSVKLPY